MELILEQGLSHQQYPIDAITAALYGVEIAKPDQYYQNPTINLDDPTIWNNIKKIQKSVPAEHRGFKQSDTMLNLDIKMETGTGKTYVYSKVMYELHQKYGFNKFIILVPSLSIKSGTKQFLQDGYTRRHFEDTCGYGTKINIGILEAAKHKQKGRSFFPGVVADFVRGSCQSKNRIHVLIGNMQLLANNKKGVLSRDDYDYGVEGFYCPFDAMKATRPVVIIDEPHRFSKDQNAYKQIISKLAPQMMIRFGATFPETQNGRGKNKVKITDYENLIYDLGACEAFNQGLIKGVSTEHFEPSSRKNEKIKIIKIDSKEAVHLQYKKGSDAKTFVRKTGDSMADICPDLEGITIAAITKNTVEFSNGVSKHAGEEIVIDIYMTSYQEQMLKRALQKHFEIERLNFNRKFKIKTLALFFIDDIASYRQVDKEPYLKNAFERLLKEQLETTIDMLPDEEAEYKAYLQASLADLNACHGGYFSRDNSDSDDAIEEEVNEILHDKKKLLAIKDAKGAFNTRRFLFSKWTLKEGWDNPNVFTIAKLRSSGSEISKLQEVGRGLRLPVDENGNRVSGEEFKLNYIVDFEERDFAEKLVKQINAEVPEATMVSEEKLGEVAEQQNIGINELMMQLMYKEYINYDRTIILENRDQFFEEYPQFQAGLKRGKVVDASEKKEKPIKIRSAVYDELKDLWLKINQHYLLFLDEDLNDKLATCVKEILENKDTPVLVDLIATSVRHDLITTGQQIEVEVSTGVQYKVHHSIPYGVFLKRISDTTSIPVKILHAGFCQYFEEHGNIAKEKINEESAAAFCAAFRQWQIKNLQGRFRYEKSNRIVSKTALSYKNGTPLTEIAQGRIGTKIEPGKPIEKYLYDAYAYDSDLEKKNMMADIESVVVYGKIPRKSIAIPTITGETYSPDFMYIIQRKDGSKVLNVVVETKDVENKSVLRETERAKIECAKVFFDALSQEGYEVQFHTQLGNRKIGQIIESILGE